MQRTFPRRPAAPALLLAALVLALAGCERRTADPLLPTTSSGPTTPFTALSAMPGTVPDGSSSAARR